MIYIPIWFDLNHIKNEKKSKGIHIYIPIWFDLNQRKHIVATSQILFTFQYGSI